MSVCLLSGIKVLDFSRILAAPYASQLLADHGCTVYKIERTGFGDEVRRWQPPQINGQSCYFMTVNRNKKSLALNLGLKEGQNIARKLALKSDVIIENFKTGQMRKFGLDYETLSKQKSDLIYCSITGYGSDGPYANEAGYDVIAEAIGGFMSITGPTNGEPCKAGVAIIDLLTGVHAFSAIMAALLNREKNGTGQKIECNLLATQIAALANIGSNYLNAGIIGRPWGTAHESIVPYQAFRTKDNRFYVIGAGDDAAFKKLCHIIDLSELAENLDYETNAKRVQNREKLLGILSQKFIMHDLNYWTHKFKNSQLPSGPVNNVAEAFEHEQVKHLGLVQEMTHSKYGKVKTIGNTVRYSSIENRAEIAPPLLGEHTVEILQQELGMASDQLTKLIDDGIIGVC